MMELEKYKNNLDVIDKFDLKNIVINKSAVYTGKTHHINKPKEEPEHNCPLLGAAIIGLDNTGAPINKKSKFCNIWTDIDAQEIHLNTKPTCFVIIGKSGCGSYNLGEAIAKKFNCIHLCPKSILIDEILQNSTTGRTWDFNFKHNKVCLFETILPMLKIKLNSAAVQHRGYVISDFPLLPCSPHPLYLIDSLHSEEAFLEVDEILLDTIRNLKKKKPEASRSVDPSESPLLEGQEEEEEEEEPPKDMQAEEVVEEEEDKPAQLPKFLLDVCSNVLTHKKVYFESKQAALLHQLQEIFNLTLPPDIIIHITCPDLDLVTKKSHKYINYMTGQTIFKPFISTYVPEVGWPAKYNISDYENPHDKHVFQPKYNCKPPTNFNERVIKQICNYERYILPFIEKKIKDHDPKMVIELDGRTTVHQMIHHVTERLILLHLQPVILPEPLGLEEPPDLEEFWDTVAGLELLQGSSVVPFKYYASPWFNRCPVELKLRRSVMGKPKYAVKFFKHVYLMSSLNHFISFCRNPRPFLKLEYLEPTCRIIITGTKSSGKSMIARCLSWIFDTPVINYQNILENERHKKYCIFEKSILSEIIATIEDTRLLEWQKIESERVTKLNMWCNATLQILNEYLPLLIKHLKYKEKETELAKSKIEEQDKPQEDEESEEEDRELTEEDQKLKLKTPRVEKFKEELDPDFVIKFEALRTRLSFLPILDNIDECEILLSNRNVSQYAPKELTTVPNKPAIPVIGDRDVSIAVSNYIVANDLQKDLEPNIEEIMLEIVTLITKIDTRRQEETACNHLYGNYIIDGLPSDPEYWACIRDPKLMPDYTIALIENREIDEELYQYYINTDKYTKHYDQKILLAKDPLITTRLQATKTSDLQNFDMQVIANDIIDDSLDFLFITNQKIEIEPSDTKLHTELIASFTEAIEKFREDWDIIKIKLEENSKSFIEIELENKNDIKVIEEVLLKLRICYCSMGEISEDEEMEVFDENETVKKDLLTYNDKQFLCETNIYCPIAYYNYNVLWEGKPEFSLKLNNKIHYFSKQEFLEEFQRDITKYQFYDKPFKNLPTSKICVIGPIGCGATSVSKHIAKELGLLYINFADLINDYILPKHFKKVGRCYENIFTDEPVDEEAVVEFQMDEENPDNFTDLIGNEKEMRRMVYNYFELGSPLLPKFTKKILKKIWFDPFVQTGFVLDGYPKNPNDVEDMLACYCIPDIVIELETTLESSISRTAPQMFNQWKSHQNDAKQIAKTKLGDERQQWMHTLTKQIVAKLVIEEIFDIIFDTEEPEKGASKESAIMDADPLGSTNVNPKLFSTYNDMVLEYPEPTDTNVWEKNYEARERIETRIETIFTSDDDNVQALKDILFEQKVKVMSVDGTKSLNKVIRKVLSNLSVLKNRCESFFEQTFIVDSNIAEMLLLKGFYFFSKFFRLCPVYIFENPEAILNSYKISKRKGQIFPVIHRAYIYFISSKDNVIKFRTNPLKYITSDVLKTYFEYPLRISVVGTPKSGKTTLAAKLAKEHGLIYLSRGSAIRSVLENLHWTDLASKISKHLLEGKKIDVDLIVKAVHTVAVDHRTVTYGFVFDDFPVLAYEAKGLLNNGLYPNIIFDISADRSKILDNSQKEIYFDIIKYMPPYPPPLIDVRYEILAERRRQKYNIRTWIAEDQQNLSVLDGNQSKWHVLHQANNNLKQATSKMHFYISNVEKTIVQPMWISNETFEIRQSQYKKFCPACFHKKIYRHMGFVGDKKGVVQYNNKFYWICNEHMESVMKYPDYYLTSREIEIPELPAIIKIINIDYIYENGICVVTYAENLPAQRIKIGTSEFAASYAGKSYLFCSEVCLHKFLDKPELYKDITVFKETERFPKLCLKNLPSIGYLEQTLGNILTEACCSVNVFRPKYPGLSFQTSALIYIALYIKTHNPLMDKDTISRYMKVLRIFEARCKMILSVGLRLRSMDNPLAPYPKCEHKPPILQPTQTEKQRLSSMQLQRPSSIPKRTSNYVQIYKPSFINASRRSTITSQMKRN